MIRQHLTDGPTDNGLLRLFRELTPAQRQRLLDDWHQRLAERSPDASPS